MKNINIYLIVCLIAFFASCTSDFESEFDLSPDERVNIELDKWQNALLSSETGWLVHYYPNPELLGGFSYVLKFDDKGVVNMNWGYSDYEDSALYSVKMIDRPLLIFETYSKFSKMTDPELGDASKGFGGELEFAFKKFSANKDTIYMEERVNKDPFILVKASATAWDDIKKYPAMNAELLRTNEEVVPFYLNLSVEGWGDTRVNMVYYDDMQKLRIYYNDGEKDVAEYMPINFTHQGFEFHHPIEINGISVRSFKYNEAKNQFDVLDEGVVGAFKYETECPIEIPGAFDLAFPANGFGGDADYMSPKMIESFKDLNPNAGFKSIGYTPYASFADISIKFDDYNSITIKDPTFEKTSENTVVFHFGEYKTEGWGADFTEEEINTMMGSEAGKLLYDILFSEKGWTIVPVFLKEYSEVYYLVSNEDPEMYMCIK